jgi:HAD superfamily hydrolase (TIGR01549 family)
VTYRTGEPQIDTGRIETVVLDIDGTLVDSVYQHTVAWTRAFQTVGLAIPAWRLHRVIGMGGDKLVTEVAGRVTEDAVGDAVREAHSEEYQQLFSSVHPLPGAERLISELKSRDLRVAVASSGSRADAERALGLLDDAGRADTVVTGDDGAATKPDPALVELAIERVGGGHAAVVGDSVWDLYAARESKQYAVALLTGGFSADDLREAGADVVLDGPSELIARLDDLLLALSD